MVDKLVGFDCRLFDKVARSHTPLLARSLPRLSHAANDSMLWIAIGGLLTAFGGRRGKRAALRGLGSGRRASTRSDNLAMQEGKVPSSPRRSHLRRTIVQIRVRTAPGSARANRPMSSQGVRTRDPKSTVSE
jgi:hypothetical protein